MEAPRTKVTAEEARNGWSVEALNIYLKERENQIIEFAAEQKLQRPLKVENVHTFNPFNWLGTEHG